MFKKDQQFYAYYDAIEETGEVIYCGKGTDFRSDLDKSPKRNKLYNDYSKNKKIIRVRIPTLDEDLALKLENWLMEQYHTWIDDPLATEHACNIDGPGCNNSKSHSQETKKLFSKQRKGKWNSWRKKATCQISLLTGELIKIFDSIQDAIKETKIRHISACCAGKFKQAGGYIWCHIDKSLTYEQILDVVQITFKNFNKIINKQQKRVRQIDINTHSTIMTYKTITEASQLTGVHGTDISLCCHKKRKTAGKFMWEFIEENNY